MFQYKHTARVCEWVHRQFCLCVNRKSTNLNVSALLQSLKFVTPKKKPQSGWSHLKTCVSNIPACFQHAAAHIWIIWAWERKHKRLCLDHRYTLWEVFQVYSVLRNASSWKSSLTEAVNELKQATSEGLTKTHRQITHEQIQKQPF